MEAPSSQSKIEEEVNDKRRHVEAFELIAKQQKAAAEAGEYSIRTFRKEFVRIKTISGEELVTGMWVSDSPSVGIRPKDVEVFVCKECGKEFDKRQKMLLHARYHNKPE